MPAQYAPRKLVFIIDENRAATDAMCLALTEERYRLETARNAPAAILKLSSIYPDLILLDSQFPTVDGARLARLLLADKDLAAVPVIELTERVSGNDSTPGPGALFDGSLRKPVDPLTLPGQVRVFLESGWRAPLKDPPFMLFSGSLLDDYMGRAVSLLGAIEAGLPDSQHTPDAQIGLHWLAEVVASFQHEELANYARQGERLSNSGTVRAGCRFRSVIRLCRDILERGPDVVPGLADLRARYMIRLWAQFGALENAMKTGDFAALAVAGHKLAGSGASYGFSELTDLGRALQAAGRENNAPDIEVLLDRFALYFSILRPPEGMANISEGFCASDLRQAGLS